MGITGTNSTCYFMHKGALPPWKSQGKFWKHLMRLLNLSDTLKPDLCILVFFPKVKWLWLAFSQKVLYCLWNLFEGLQIFLKENLCNILWYQCLALQIITPWDLFAYLSYQILTFQKMRLQQSLPWKIWLQWSQNSISGMAILIKMNWIPGIIS